MTITKRWNSNALGQLSLFLICTEELQSHAGSRSSFYHPPCSAHSSPTSLSNTSSSSSLLEIRITVHSAGIAGIFQIFAWFFSSFINHLNCHRLREASPDQLIKSCSFLYHYPVEFLSQHYHCHSLKLLPSFFFFLPFNCLFLPSSLGFKFHENRDFVYFPTYPTPGTMVGTQPVLHKYFFVKQMHEWVFMKSFS